MWHLGALVVSLVSLCCVREGGVLWRASFQTHNITQCTLRGPPGQIATPAAPAAAQKTPMKKAATPPREGNRGEMEIQDPKARPRRVFLKWHRAQPCDLEEANTHPPSRTTSQMHTKSVGDLRVKGWLAQGRRWSV